MRIVSGGQTGVDRGGLTGDHSGPVESVDDVEASLVDHVAGLDVDHVQEVSAPGALEAVLVQGGVLELGIHAAAATAIGPATSCPRSVVAVETSETSRNT